MTEPIETPLVEGNTVRVRWHGQPRLGIVHAFRRNKKTGREEVKVRISSPETHAWVPLSTVERRD